MTKRTMRNSSTNQSNKNSKIAVILRRVLLAVLGIVLGVNLYLANVNAVTRNHLPMPFGMGIAVVLSGSMEPELRVDDLVVVKKASDYKENDIVVYQRNQYLVMHRVVSLDGDVIVTKGDANNVADEPIARSYVKGVVVGHIPWMGKIVRILKTPAGILLIFVLAVMLVEMSFQKKKEKDNEELEKIKDEIERLRSTL